jgi:hypothetical protein
MRGSQEIAATSKSAPEVAVKVATQPCSKLGLGSVLLAINQWGSLAMASNNAMASKPPSRVKINHASGITAPSASRSEAVARPTLRPIWRDELAAGRDWPVIG